MSFSLDLWFEYLLRFSHLVAGIAWIGSSFYFIWLDSAFEPPKVARRNVDGELFMLHGGFYYQVEKRKIYPGEIPTDLHWFKWEATLTWVTGFFLFGFLYWLRGAGLLIDPRVLPLTQIQAIGLSVLIVAAAWFIYDLVIWNANLGLTRWSRVFLSTLFFGGLIFGLTRVFSGRGAFMVAGMTFGSLMLLNVWVRILPGQAKMLREAQAGRVPDYSASLKSKTRSVHNTYFTFPVLFIMLSNHYPPVYAHPYNWLLLILLAVSGALVRHAMVTKRPLERWTLLPAAAGLLALVFMTGMPAGAPAEASPSGPPVPFAVMSDIVHARCLECHSSHNTDDAYKEAPRGILLENEAEIRQHADMIQFHVVVAKSMPLANKTNMTDLERTVVARWLKEQGLVHTP